MKISEKLSVRRWDKRCDVINDGGNFQFKKEEYKIGGGEGS